MVQLSKQCLQATRRILFKSHCSRTASVEKYRANSSNFATFQSDRVPTSAWHNLQKHLVFYSATGINSSFHLKATHRNFHSCRQLTFSGCPVKMAPGLVTSTIFYLSCRIPEGWRLSIFMPSVTKYKLIMLCHHNEIEMKHHWTQIFFANSILHLRCANNLLTITSI